MAVRPNSLAWSTGFSSPSDEPEFSPPDLAPCYIDTFENERMQINFNEETVSDVFPENRNYPMQLRSDQQRIQSLRFQAPQQYTPVAHGISETLQPRGDNATEGPAGVVGLPEHLAPLNLVDQEILKLERKRERNRIAAAKCRRKKLERIAYEEKRISLYKAELEALQITKERLENELKQVRLEAWKHLEACCDISVPKDRLIVKHPLIGGNPNL